MRVAVITGASRGLGREMAIALNRSGFAIAFTYLRSEKEAGELAQLLGATSMAVRADVRDFPALEGMANTVSERWGRVDVLINNAGIAKDGLLLRYGESDFDEVLDVNLKGCFNATKAFAPPMIKSGGGHIVNVSSYSAIKGKPGQAAYSASKAGIIGLTRSAARELSGYNIRINAVLPGYMPTEMGRSAAGAMGGAMEESLLHSLSDPEEAARFIAHLITTKNVTGQVFSVESRI